MMRLIVATLIGLGSTGMVRLYAQTPGDCDRGNAEAFLDVNNVRALIHNTGSLFWDDQVGRGVYEAPKNSGRHTMLAASVWIGGLDIDRDLRMSATTYGPFEFWPGPLDAEGNPPTDCNRFDRLYSVYQEDIDSYEVTGELTDALLSWPAELGAPVIDGDGIPDNYDLDAGDRPRIIGDQSIWWIMNDLGGRKEWTDTEPIGLKVQAMAFAFDDSTALGNTTFYRYRFAHRGTEPLHKTYVAIWADPDVGFRADDFMGVDTSLSTGYAFNGDDFDESTPNAISDGYESTIPAIGFQLLEPRTRQVISKANLAKFIEYNPATCVTNCWPSRSDFYHMMQGNWRDNTPLTFGGNGYGGSKVAHHMYPSNPVKREYWSEENRDQYYSRSDPGDRRFVMSHGPFDLYPGDEVEFTFAIIWSQAGDRLASVAKLLEDAVYIRGFYDLGFQEMDPIDAPVLSAVAGDQHVTLEWENPASSNNANESYDTRSGFLYSKLGDDSTYTFEGYDIFQFDSAIDSVGIKIATYDIKNHLAVVVDEAFDYEQGAYIESVTATGENSGIVHSHVVSNLTNYRDHHFGIQSYAYNEHSWPNVIRSEMTRITVTPGGTRADDEAIASLERVGISPNPYKGQSDYEVNGDSRSVRFTGMPEVATIRVFTLAGTLVSEMEKNDSLPFYEWDLMTDEGRSLGGGVYLIHVSSPGLGERVIKFGHVGREL